jgi:hypothetical protein
MLVFNFICDLFWTVSGSPVSSVAFVWFSELKYIEKLGFKAVYASKVLYFMKLTVMLLMLLEVLWQFNCSR